ncbi:MAG: amidase [Actinomycetota bacterium]|jgi:amidase|nr:amidase [Actinomycetota bacterium]
MSEDLVYLPAVEHARLIRERVLSPVELVTAYLDRAEALNPALNCYITVAAEQALEAARVAEKRVMEGGPLPPLHGVVVAIKDLTDTAGIRTTMGTSSYADRVPTQDAYVVSRLKAAGCIVLAKSNTAEFGVGSTDPLTYGPARNPWDLARTTRGSSGGAAAAAAAGMCSVAHGTDGGGSIRLPAATCGAVGLKPSRGRISSAPAGQHMQVQAGTLSRSVADAAATLDALSGPVPGDGFWAPELGRLYLDELALPVRRLRIVVTTSFREAPVHPEYVEAVQKAARAFEQMGHDVVDGSVPWPSDEVIAKFIWAFSARLLAMDQSLPPFESLDPTLRELIEQASQVTLTDYLLAEQEQGALTRVMGEWFADVDLLLTPTVTGRPRGVDQLRKEGGAMADDPGVGPFCFIWNMTGQPAISVPMGLDSEGLPLSVQLVAGAARDGVLLQAAHQLEKAVAWSGRPAL